MASTSSTLNSSPLARKNSFASSRVFTDLGERLVARDDLAHLLFDGREIFRREWLVAVEIVVEAILDHRADGHLGAGKQFLHRLGQHMGAVMADEFEGFGIVARDDPQAAHRAVIGSARSLTTPLTTAATAFFSSDLEMEAATCAAVVPASTWRVAPSGNVKVIIVKPFRPLPQTPAGRPITLNSTP